MNFRLTKNQINYYMVIADRDVVTEINMQICKTVEYQAINFQKQKNWNVNVFCIPESEKNEIIYSLLK